MNTYTCPVCDHQHHNEAMEVDKGSWRCNSCKVWNMNQVDVSDYNVGTSDYATKKIQPWDIWEEYGLDPWRADIVKRILRNKEGDDPVLDLEKIKHICDKLIQMENAK